MKIMAPAWQCEFCGHKWLAQDESKPPDQCANTKCKKRGWNKGKTPPDPRAIKARLEVKKRLDELQSMLCGLCGTRCIPWGNGYMRCMKCERTFNK